MVEIRNEQRPVCAGEVMLQDPFHHPQFFAFCAESDLSYDCRATPRLGLLSLAFRVNREFFPPCCHTAYSQWLVCRQGWIRIPSPAAHIRNSLTLLINSPMESPLAYVCLLVLFQ